MSMSIAEYKKTVKKPSKYRNIRVEVDGIKFQSKREAARWGELRILEAAGEIEDLKRQVRYALIVGTVRVGTFVADFTYVEKTGAMSGQPVIEDVKGRRDSREVGYQLFKIKAALMKAIYGLKVREV